MLHPLEEQRKSVREWRQIGLGVMGIADMLIKMNLPYDSDEAIKLCDFIGFVMINSAILESANLAKKDGTYPNFQKEFLKNNKFFKDNTTNDTKALVQEYGLRNSQLLTIAPTGTLSSMLGISGGIEPIFANSYTRKTESLHEKEEYYKVYTPIVQEYMNKNKLKDESELPKWFVTSSTIDSKKRVLMQAIWQKHIDASISSTVNLPENSTIEQIEELYMMAWENGLKGLTIFRSGCKRMGVLTTETKENKELTQNFQENMSFVLKRGDIINCSDNLIGKKKKIISGCGSLHVLAYFDPVTNEMQEVYLNKGSTGGCANFMTGLSRMISLLCRAGVDVYTIKDQLDSTGACPSYAVRSATKHDTSKGSCCPMAIGNALVEMYEEFVDEYGSTDFEEEEDNNIKQDNKITASQKKNNNKKTEIQSSKTLCPECGEPLVFEGGCNSCKSCGYSKCD